MDIIATILIIGAAAALIWHVVATMMIYDNLRKRGEKVSFIWLRLFSTGYAARYRELTRKETGKTGPLFFHYVFSINAVLLFIVLAVIVREV